MSVLALIPARAGSKGIPGKNFRELGYATLVEHAVHAAYEAAPTVDSPIVVSSDASKPARRGDGYLRHAQWLNRPAALAQDDTPMLSVVQHVLTEFDGSDDQIVLILQPTQPFRTPEHVRKAIVLLQETGADSVVSVVPLPLTHSPEFQCVIGSGLIIPDAGRLYPYPVHEYYEETRSDFSAQPKCRQDADQTYIRDGTVYAFWRKTVTQFGTIYGHDVRPLILDPSESCELDTEADWAEVERRWNAR